MAAHLKVAGISTGIHYPIPLHLQKAYSSKGHKAGDFPVCEKVSSEILSLPMFPQLTAQQQARVVREVLHFAQSEAAAKPMSSESSELAATGRTA
jgi:dTDP-4-amino-4,6-dideoxygalactose transaminase